MYWSVNDNSQSMFVPVIVERQLFFTRVITLKRAYTVFPCMLTDRETRHPYA
jgi:hypothetical protein